MIKFKIFIILVRDVTRVNRNGQNKAIKIFFFLIFVKIFTIL